MFRAILLVIALLVMLSPVGARASYGNPSDVRSQLFALTNMATCQVTPNPGTNGQPATITGSGYLPYMNLVGGNLVDLHVYTTGSTAPTDDLTILNVPLNADGTLNYTFIAPGSVSPEFWNVYVFNAQPGKVGPYQLRDSTWLAECNWTT